MSDQITIIELWPRESECCICGKHLIGCKTAIAMYEGHPVPDNWPYEWAGFDACTECFDKHGRGELPTWRYDKHAMIGLDV